jgi:hypothetical protein
MFRIENKIVSVNIRYIRQECSFYAHSPGIPNLNFSQVFSFHLSLRLPPPPFTTPITDLNVFLAVRNFKILPAKKLFLILASPLCITCHDDLVNKKRPFYFFAIKWRQRHPAGNDKCRWLNWEEKWSLVVRETNECI